jgi:hypothetical protein
MQEIEEKSYVAFYPSHGRLTGGRGRGIPVLIRHWPLGDQLGEGLPWRERAGAPLDWASSSWGTRHLSGGSCQAAAATGCIERVLRARWLRHQHCLVFPICYCEPQRPRHGRCRCPWGAMCCGVV